MGLIYLKPRLGLYGGGFDPPHKAHVALAAAAIEQLRLDKLVVMPTGDAYHKARTLSAGAHRLAMCELAFAGLPQVTVSDMELRRRGSSFTYDTLHALRQAQPGAHWFLLMGADQAQVFHRWHRWADILQQATLAIAVRPDPSNQESGWRADDPLPGTGVPAAGVKLLDFPAMDCSASRIRESVAGGQAVDAWVPQAVARYIDAHHLYSTPI